MLYNKAQNQELFTFQFWSLCMILFIQMYALTSQNESLIDEINFILTFGA